MAQLQLLATLSLVDSAVTGDSWLSDFVVGLRCDGNGVCRGRPPSVVSAVCSNVCCIPQHAQVFLLGAPLLPLVCVRVDVTRVWQSTKADKVYFVEVQRWNNRQHVPAGRSLVRRLTRLVACFLFFLCCFDLLRPRGEPPLPPFIPALPRVIGPHHPSSKVDQSLVAGGNWPRHCVGRVRLRRRGKRYWRLGVRGQPHPGLGDPPRGFVPPRSHCVGGGGLLADEGEEMTSPR